MYCSINKNKIIMSTKEMTPAEKVAHIRAIRREASRRCRARAKMIEKGEMIPPELAIRSAQPKAKRVENYKVNLGNKQLRLNRNGGEKVALVVTESGKKTRKSFKNIDFAIKNFTKHLQGE